MKFLLLLVILISSINITKNLTSNKFIIICQFLITLYLLLNKKKLLLLCSKIYFNNSNFINIKNYKSLNEYLNNNLNSKKRIEIRKDIKKLDQMKVIKTNFSFNHLYYLYNFLTNKFKNNFVLVNFNFMLSLFVIFTFKLTYFNFFDSNNKLLGWSSYFIDDEIYYDFLSSPNNIHVSHIIINSLKYCLNNEISKIDYGPTHDDVKRRKINTNKYVINVSIIDLFT